MREERVGALFDAHADRLYRLARRLAANRDDALDLVQETFLRIARSPGAVPHGSREEEAWLVRVLVNIRRDQWRKESVRTRHHSTVARVESGRNPEGSYVVRTTVWEALDHLTPRRRAVIVMHELEGLSLTTIASLLGITSVTARWHLALGRRELARRIHPTGGARHARPQDTVARRRPHRPRTSVP